MTRLPHLIRFCLYTLFFTKSFAETPPPPPAPASPTIHTKDKIPPRLNPTPATLSIPDDHIPALFENTIGKSYSDAVQCMRGTAYKTIVYGNTYYRVTNTMPIGYFLGAIHAYVNNKCDMTKNQEDKSQKKLSANEIALNKYREAINAKPNSKNENDSLVHLGAMSGDPLINIHALNLSLGSIETDGTFDEGRDPGARNSGSKTAEAATYQASFNSVRGKVPLKTTVPTDIYNALLFKYGIKTDAEGDVIQTGPNCQRDLYTVGKKQSLNVASWGDGDGYKFQEAFKKCPALAFDYQAILLRHTFAHNGPTKRKEAQIKDSCSKVMSAVDEQIKLHPDLCNVRDKLEKKLIDFSAKSTLFNDADKLSAVELPADSYLIHEVKKSSKSSRYNEIPWINNVIGYDKKKLLEIADSDPLAHEKKDKLNAEIKLLEERIVEIEKSPEEVTKKIASLENSLKSVPEKAINELKVKLAKTKKDSTKYAVLQARIDSLVNYRKVRLDTKLELEAHLKTLASK